MSSLAHRVEGSFTGARGLRIHWRAWLPEASPPRAQLVIAHGAGEHGDRYERLAQPLVARGFAVWAPDHQGHGHSEGPVGVISIADTVADLDAIVRLAESEAPGAPIFLLGHSMGGAIALSYALSHQNKLAGLVLSAPAAALGEKPGAPVAARVGAALAARVAPRLPIHKLDLTGVSRDSDELAKYMHDPLIDRKPMRARTIGELVGAFARFPDAVGSLTLPLLVMHGTADRLTPPGGSKMLAERAGSQDKTLRLYEGYYHELINEPPAERQKVLDEIVSWLDARAPAV